MSNPISQAEALLNNFELKIRSDYGPTDEHDISDVGQEIPEAPGSVREKIVEAGESFYEGRNNATPFATDQELDEAEKYFEQAFDEYERAVENHLGYQDSQELVDVDLVIDQAINGEVDEDSVVEAAGVQTFVVDDLESDQRHIRRNMEDQEAYEFLEQSGYDTDSVVHDHYIQDVRQAEELTEEGISEIR